MSLAERLAALVGGISEDIKGLFTRALPAGGAAGQVLAKASATDFAVEWVPPGGGSQQVFVQPEAPVVPPGTPYIWWQTGLGETGNDMTLWVEDGL